jgi:hypothetical protein
MLKVALSMVLGRRLVVDSSRLEVLGQFRVSALSGMFAVESVLSNDSISKSELAIYRSMTRAGCALQ